MDVELMKGEILIVFRELEDEARTLIDRIAKARADLERVKTEEDLRKFADTDLEEGLKFISLIAR